MARPKVILFDVNETLLDLTPVKESVGKALGGRPELVPLWFTTLLHYSLATTVADKYFDFAEIGAACLRMVAKSHGIELSENTTTNAITPMRTLAPHPDVVPAMERLRDANYRLLALTNSSKATMEEQMTFAGLTKLFDGLLSVENVGKYKPHAEVYLWAAGQVETEVSECLLVAAHGWDVAGAAWVGMKTAFVARPGQQMFPLGPVIDIKIASLTELPKELERL